MSKPTLQARAQFLGDVPNASSPIVELWMGGARSLLDEALAEIERLSSGLSETTNEPRPCCGEYETCMRPCTPRGEQMAYRKMNKTDPVKRLHNLCDALEEHRAESPYNAEALELADASYKAKCAELRRVTEYAEQVSAPARELLELYDWRPKLAELEKCDMETWGKLQSDTKTYLRQYGERKKAGWIALRAALAKNPNPAGPSVSAEAFGGSPLPSSQGDVLSAEASGAGGAGTRWCCEGVPCQHLGWCNSDYCAALDPKRDSRTQSGTKFDPAHEARQIWISITGNGEGLWKEWDRQSVATLTRCLAHYSQRPQVVREDEELPLGYRVRQCLRSLGRYHPAQRVADEEVENSDVMTVCRFIEAELRTVADTKQGETP